MSSLSRDRNKLDAASGSLKSNARKAFPCESFVIEDAIEMSSVELQIKSNVANRS